MKAKIVVASVASAFSLAFASPAHAAPNGWFDCLTIGSSDSITGWICESTDPFNTASYGVLSVYVNGPAGTGSHYGDYYAGGGVYRPDVPAAGFCGSNNYAGFGLAGWYWTHPSTTIYLYFKDNNNNLTLLGGSPKTLTGPGTVC